MAKLHLRNKETLEREMVDTDIVTDYLDKYEGPEGENLEPAETTTKKK